MTPTTIAYTFGDDHQIVTLSAEEVRQRLGSEATAGDAAAFMRIWHTRFYDVGAPDFDADDDRDDTWSEIVALMTDDFSGSATV